ncbi:MAG TPA: nucleoside triphosphate pyrophosphohydrolase [Candidatus Paceibacterota bacterium]
MGRVYYNKLIRDSIPEKIAKNGEECETRTLSDDQEFEQELLKKVAEEAVALSRARTKEDLLDEFGDLLEVLDALKTVEGISEGELEAARAKNRAEKGGFVKRLFLHWSSDSKYRSNETPQGIPLKEK